MCSSKANQQPSLSNSLIITISKIQIMKKTYINPSMIVVRLSMNNIIAASPNTPPSTPVNTSDPYNPNDFNTKGISDVNVWDNEW